MRDAKKVVLTCAITGSVHTPTMSPHLPITEAEIATAAIEAAEAGASMVHLHARDPVTGQPTQDPERFRGFLPVIRQASDVIVNITTGGALGMPIEERIAPAKAFGAEVASLNMGSMNFGFWELAGKRNDWKHEWEPEFLQSSYDLVYPNTFKMIDHIIDELGANGTRFEFECYDVGHLYNLAYFFERERIKPPLFIQCILGARGGIGAEIENLVHMRSVADRLFGDNYYLSCLSIGPAQQMKLLTHCALMGGSVRVGLEDNLYIAKGELASSNAQQVQKIKSVLSEFGIAVATPDEAREMLQLKGGDRVNF